ncbi:hypothetical protein PVAND_012211 [Polypedilum vanderplanki]|uniref:Uncharacterized protein n=1 Tax=Polypedilum vanderplanki TaxID=319348 RepID=A0A9J6CLQ8_POLVA|nr:hypothetical protein PVAND_012211 [Polypedilum vanderplanki]
MESEIIVDSANKNKLNTNLLKKINFDNSDYVFYDGKLIIESLSYCEHNLLTKRKADGCKTVKDNSPFFVKLSDFKFFFYNTEINIKCAVSKLKLTCKSCIIELLPKCQIETDNGLKHTAPETFSNFNYPTLINIENVMNDSSDQMSSPITRNLKLNFDEKNSFQKSFEEARPWIPYVHLVCQIIEILAFIIGAIYFIFKVFKRCCSKDKIDPA